MVASFAAGLAAAACLGPATAEPSGCAGTVAPHAYALGDTVSDTLTAHTCRQLYGFTAVGQANVRFRLSSPGLQTLLQLYDERGAVVMNSGLTEPLDTATTVRMMIGPGSYVLAVIPLNQGQRGTFRLATEADTGAVGACGTVWVTTGIATTQTLTTADCTQGPAGTSYYTHVYALVLLVGQEVELSESAAAMPPWMALIGQGMVFPSVRDSAGRSAVIASTIISQGAYSLWVGSSSPGRTGTYTLQVR